MFDHDLDQSLLILVLPILVVFALPFVMDWLEESLDGEPLTPSQAWAAVESACSELWSRTRSIWTRP